MVITALKFMKTTVTNMFIVNLAIADIIFLAVSGSEQVSILVSKNNSKNKV